MACIASKLPIGSPRHPCHSMGNATIDISNCFMGPFSLEPIKTNMAISRLGVIPIDYVDNTPALPGDGTISVTPPQLAF